MRVTVTLPALATAALAITCMRAVPAQAHFLWANIDSPKSALNLSFTEGLEGVTTGVTVDKIAGARAWSGKDTPLSLTTAGAVRTAGIPAGARVAGAAQTWGVLDKSDEGRGLFLLEYYAKAAPNAEAAADKSGLALELFTRRTADEVIAQLLHNGTAVAAANVKLFSPDSAQERDLTTDARGEVRFAALKPGSYGLRATLAEDKKGVYEGKPYNLVRSYSTLTFAVAETPGAKPAGNANADPVAYGLLENAHNSRQVMPDDFAGFDAQLVFHKGPVNSTGTVHYRRKGETTVELPDVSKEDKEWVQGQILNIVGHRRGGSFAQGDGKNPLSLDKSPDNEFGTLINVNDNMESSYRVRDNKVTEVTRVAGDTRFTISVVQTFEADPGKYLANHFMVAYRDKNTGALKEVEGYRDSYAKVGSVWLPASRTVIRFGNETTPTERTIRFKDFKLVEPVKVAANITH